MAFTILFPSAIEDLASAGLDAWLTAQGEPFEEEGNAALSLRALPVRLVVPEGGPVQAHLDLTPRTPLSRLVELLFALSMHLGADVRLVGVGAVTRATLWLRLADEQDRRRIGEALEKADVHGRRDEVMRGLWALLSSLREGDDIRWDVGRQAAVRLVEIGEEGGISLEDAAWHCEEPREGDTVALPVVGDVHILAWRWLAEAWPALAGT